MNTLTGKITKIETEGHLSLVSVNVGDLILKSIVIETPATVSYLKIGNRINLLFKETEVVISKHPDVLISLQNQIPCKITRIENGKLLCKLDLQFQKHNLTSIITSNAVKNLALNVDDDVTAMVKTNEMMLSEL